MQKPATLGANGRMSNNMSLYYFHVRRGNVIYLDHQGVDLADLRSAWDHALDDAAFLLRATPVGLDTERWIEVDDDFGHIVSTPPVGTAFH
jgi:hypothetical protein